MISKKTVKFIHILWNKQTETETETYTLSNKYNLTRFHVNFLDSCQFGDRQGLTVPLSGAGVIYKIPGLRTMTFINMFVYVVT